MSADTIHAMSETLAADPASLVFIPLAEALLGRGDLVRAARVAQRGMARHPGRVDAHDLVARIALAQGDEARAEAAWRAVLGIDPSFGTAHRGLGLVRYRQGRLDEALEHLGAAAHEDPADATVRTALDAVRSVIAARDAAVPSPPAAHAGAEFAAHGAAHGAAHDASQGAADGTRTVEHPSAGHALEHADVAGDSAAALFDPILADSKVVALLLDEYGLVAGGQYHTASGADLGSEIGAHLTGVGEEAARAMRHFGLGQWTRLAIETEAATLAMAPAGTHAVLIAAPRDVPLGFVRRTLERCIAVARLWLGEVA